MDRASPATLVVFSFFLFLLFFFLFPFTSNFFFNGCPPNLSHVINLLLHSFWVGQYRRIFSSQVMYCPSLRSSQYTATLELNIPLYCPPSHAKMYSGLVNPDRLNPKPRKSEVQNQLIDNKNLGVKVMFCA